MRVTIIRDDGIVGMSGLFRKVDLSGLHPSIRVVQWNNDHGHIEFYDDKANLEITDFTDFQPFVEAWNGAVTTAPTTKETNPREQMIVTRFQALAVLLNAGLLETVESYFETSDNPLHKLAWKQTLHFYRLSPLVTAVGQVLNLSDDQLDQLFIAAAAIEI